MKIKILSLLMITVLLVTVSAACAKKSQPTFGSFVNSSQVPDGSVLIVNVVYKVENSYDSGIYGYWALIDLTRHLQIWETPTPGEYYVVNRDVGKWYTFIDAVAPGSFTYQTEDGWGTFQGGYLLTVTGTFNPTINTQGNLGTYDYGGTEEFIKLGTYGNQGSPVLPGYFNWLDAYFDAYSYSYVDWGWTYNYKSQTWNNFAYGNSGDIII
jgi:hypothetical protein